MKEQSARVPHRSSAKAVANIGASVAFFLLVFTNGFAQDKGREADNPSCLSNEFQLFTCKTDLGEVLGLCVTHDLKLYYLQNTAAHETVRMESKTVEEAVQSTSAHSSSVTLRLFTGKETKTFFALFASFEQQPVAIVTEGSDRVEYCEPPSTRWQHTMFEINGEARFMRVQNLIRIGLATALRNPPAYPMSNK